MLHMFIINNQILRWLKLFLGIIFLKLFPEVIKMLHKRGNKQFLFAYQNEAYRFQGTFILNTTVSSASTQRTNVPRNSVMLIKVTFHLSLMSHIYSFSLKTHLTVTDMVHGTRVQRAARVPLGIVGRIVTRLVPQQRRSQQPPRN